jgi:hypothetical protein
MPCSRCPSLYIRMNTCIPRLVRAGCLITVGSSSLVFSLYEPKCIRSQVYQMGVYSSYIMNLSMNFQCMYTLCGPFQPTLFVLTPLYHGLRDLLRRCLRPKSIQILVCPLNERPVRQFAIIVHSGPMSNLGRFLFSREFSNSPQPDCVVCVFTQRPVLFLFRVTFRVLGLQHILDFFVSSYLQFVSS